MLTYQSDSCLVLSNTDILVYNRNPGVSMKTAFPLSPALIQHPVDASPSRDTDVLPLTETFLLTKPPSMEYLAPSDSRKPHSPPGHPGTLD